MPLQLSSVCEQEWAHTLLGREKEAVVKGRLEMGAHTSLMAMVFIAWHTPGRVFRSGVKSPSSWCCCVDTWSLSELMI